MKTIWRILIILLAITAVAGITYALGQTQFFSQLQNVDGSFAGGRPAPGDFDGDALPFERGGRPEPGEGFAGRGGERDQGGFNLFAMAAFMRTLIPIALVTLAVILTTKLATWLRTRPRKEQTEPPANLTHSA